MKQMQRLKILNFQEEGKREIIYLVIFFLSVYTYYPFQSEQQLEEFLSDARLSLADLVQVGSREIDRDGKHFIVKNFEASPHIGVSRYEEIGPNNDIQSVSYRVGLAGKSPTEILDQSGRVFQHINVTRTEMEEAFRIAKYEGLIKRVMVFRKEGRYEIADERLEDFISDCYELFRLILSKLQIVWKNIRKPNTKEVKWLELFRGRRQADKIRAEAYHYRHSLSKRKKTKIVRQTKEEVKVHEEKINKYWDYIFEKHLETIKKYRFPTEEILRITFPNFLRKSV